MLYGYVADVAVDPMEDGGNALGIGGALGCDLARFLLHFGYAGVGGADVAADVGVEVVYIAEHAGEAHKRQGGAGGGGVGWQLEFGEPGGGEGDDPVLAVGGRLTGYGGIVGHVGGGNVVGALHADGHGDGEGVLLNGVVGAYKCHEAVLGALEGAGEFCLHTLVGALELDGEDAHARVVEEYAGACGVAVDGF